jgi:hypothetical protein
LYLLYFFYVHSLPCRTQKVFIHTPVYW